MIIGYIYYLWVLLGDQGATDEEILVPDWLIISHVTSITSSDWLFPCVDRFMYPYLCFRIKVLIPKVFIPKMFIPELFIICPTQVNVSSEVYIADTAST